VDVAAPARLLEPAGRPQLGGDRDRVDRLLPRVDGADRREDEALRLEVEVALVDGRQDVLDLARRDEERAEQALSASRSCGGACGLGASRAAPAQSARAASATRRVGFVLGPRASRARARRGRRRSDAHTRRRRSSSG
jgi:hypothetical protein